MLETNKSFTQAQTLEQLRASIYEAQKAYIKTSARGPEVSAEYGHTLEQRILQLRANVSTVQKAYIKACVKTGNLQVMDESGNTLLHLAAMLDPVDALEVVPVLVETHKANLNARNEAGESPLFFAVHDLGLVRYLLKQGANPNITDVNGNTALCSAVYVYVSSDIVQCLIEQGASIPLTMDCRMVQRFYNAAYQKPGVAEKHREACAKWNPQQDTTQKTLLHVFKNTPENVPENVKEIAPRPRVQSRL